MNNKEYTQTKARLHVSIFDRVKHGLGTDRARAKYEAMLASMSIPELEQLDRMTKVSVSEQSTLIKSED